MVVIALALYAVNPSSNPVEVYFYVKCCSKRTKITHKETKIGLVHFSKIFYKIRLIVASINALLSFSLFSSLFLNFHWFTASAFVTTSPVAAAAASIERRLWRRLLLATSMTAASMERRLWRRWSRSAESSVDEVDMLADVSSVVYTVGEKILNVPAYNKDESVYCSIFL